MVSDGSALHPCSQPSTPHPTLPCGFQWTMHPHQPQDGGGGDQRPFIPGQRQSSVVSSIDVAVVWFLQVGKLFWASTSQSSCPGRSRAGSTPWERCWLFPPQPDSSCKRLYCTTKWTWGTLPGRGRIATVSDSGAVAWEMRG